MLRKTSIHGHLVRSLRVTTTMMIMMIIMAVVVDRKGRESDAKSKLLYLCNTTLLLLASVMPCRVMIITEAGDRLLHRKSLNYPIPAGNPAWRSNDTSMTKRVRSPYH
jgi:hypothetical protein